jgi:hypothetical protein
MDDVNATTMGGEEYNNIAPRQLSFDAANATSIVVGVDMNTTVQQQPAMDDVNAATTMGGEEGNNIAQE